LKFALMAFNAGNGRDPATVYRENLELARLADELGFHAVWLTEHHFSDYSLLNDPTLFASALAVTTERVRIGTAVMVLPVHNAIRVAENAAIVDQLSGGRFDLGVGRGYQPKEFAGFGVDMADSQAIFDESLEVIRRLWADERASFEGQHYRFEDVELVPRPLQSPHPPIWLAAVSPGTFERAGRQGQAILTSPNFTPIDMIRDNFEAYRSALRDSGHDPTAFEYPIMQQIYVGSDERDGHDRPRDYAMTYYRSLGRLLPSDEEMVSSDYDFYKKVGRNVADLRYEYLYNNGVAFGDAEQVTGRIRTLAEATGMTYYIGWFNFGGIPHADAMRSVERFAEHVMPQFAEDRQTADAKA
jgi:natural product biosynthesis luciferase-like monooxygenase protein